MAKNLTICVFVIIASVLVQALLPGRGSQLFRVGPAVEIVGDIGYGGGGASGADIFGRYRVAPKPPPPGG